MKSIYDFNLGDRILIQEINLPLYSKERMMSLGFIKNSIIEVIRFSKSKSIIVFEVRGTMIALRDVDAKLIYGNILIKEW